MRSRPEDHPTESTTSNSRSPRSIEQRPLKLITLAGGTLNYTKRSYTTSRWTAWSQLTQTLQNPPTDQTQRTSTYPAPGSTRPHALSRVDITGTGARTDTFTYDEAGNTVRRVTADGDQALEWDTEGHLAKSTTAGKSTTFLYDADGNRLLRREPDAVTLYLDGQELKLDKTTNKVTGTRYIAIAGATIVKASDGTLNYLIPDQQGTAQLTISADNLAYTRGDTTPFGTPRGKKPASWPTERGFVGGTNDATTGLTHLGAREYDAANGRFISVDPVLDLASPQQINGYAYGDNDPVNKLDPSGLKPEGCGTEGACYGYSPGNGCQGGTCGGSANLEWGAQQGLTPNNGGGCKPGDCGTPRGELSFWDWQVLKGILQQYWDYNNKNICLDRRGCHTQAEWQRDNADRADHFQKTTNVLSGIAHGVEMAGGSAAAGFGGALFATGAAECGTGVLCPVGAPSMAGGAAIAVPGIAAAVDGARGLADDAGKLLSESDSSWIPESGKTRLPDAWGSGTPTQKGVGWRWNDGKGNGVRIDQGNPNNSQDYQQIDHVVVNYRGKIIGRDGKPIDGSVKQNAYMAHIPLKDWLTWKNWYSPG